VYLTIRGIGKCGSDSAVGKSVALENMAEMLRSVVDRILQSKVDVVIVLKERTVKDGCISESEGDYVSIKRAAGIMNLSATKIRREILAGRLAASNVGSRGRPLYRILKSDLLKWVQADRGIARPQIRRLYRRKVRSRFFGEI
jgi:hypothetical protein